MEWQSNVPWVVRISHTILSLPIDSEALGVQSGRAAVLTSSSVESLLCLLVEAFHPLEQKPLGYHSIRPQEQGAKILPVGNYL